MSRASARPPAWFASPPSAALATPGRAPRRAISIRAGRMADAPGTENAKRRQSPSSPLNLPGKRQAPIQSPRRGANVTPGGEGRSATCPSRAPLASSARARSAATRASCRPSRASAARALLCSTPRGFAASPVRSTRVESAAATGPGWTSSGRAVATASTPLASAATAGTSTSAECVVAAEAPVTFRASRCSLRSLRRASRCAPTRPNVPTRLTCSTYRQWKGVERVGSLTLWDPLHLDRSLWRGP